MRIAHIIKELNPALGGTVSVPLNLARWTAARGVDVEIWTGDRFDWEPPTDLQADSDRPGGITIHERKGPDGLLDRAFFKRFEPDIERVDLLHTHNLWDPFAARFVFAGSRFGTPVLHTMHGMLMDWPRGHKRPKKLVYLKLVGARQLRATTAVHMLNAEETRQSKHAGANFRFFELPNGVDTTEFDALPTRGTYRATEPDLRDRTIILSMGRLHEIKGTDLLLESFLELAKTRQDIALVLAGPEEGLGSKLNDMLRGHPAANRVKMPGLVTGELRLALLADADLYAHCSRHETMSMAILEAAYAGKAMLVTDRCNCPEVAQWDAGVVVDVNAAAIRRGLEQLLADQDQLVQRGRRARAMVQQQFTAEVVTPQLIEHYQRLIAGEPYPWVFEE